MSIAAKQIIAAGLKISSKEFGVIPLQPVDRWLDLKLMRGMETTLIKNAINRGKVQGMVLDDWERWKNIFVLKARQQGVTTVVLAKLFIQAVTKPGCRIVIVLPNAKFSLRKQLYTILTIYWQSFCETAKKYNLRVPKKHTDNIGFFGWDDTESFISLLFSSPDNAGLGEAYNIYYFTDIFKWQDPEATLEVLLPSLAENAEGIIDGTGQPFGYAKELYERCREGKGIWKECFYPASLSYSHELLENRRKAFKTPAGFKRNYPETREEAFMIDSSDMMPHPDEWGRYNPEVFDWGKLKRVVGYLDTASGKNMQDGDFAAIAVVGMMTDGTIVLLDIWNRKDVMHLGQISKVFDLHQWLRLMRRGKGFDCFVIEADSQEMIKGYVENERERRMHEGIYAFPVKYVHPYKNKLDRIQTLEYLIKNKELIFPEKKTFDFGKGEELVLELTSFPDMEHDDCADSLAGACEELTQDTMFIGLNNIEFGSMGFTGVITRF